MIKYIMRNFCLLFLSGAFFIAPAFASENSTLTLEERLEIENSNLQKREEAASEEVPSEEEIDGIIYVPPSLDNLSQLYWKLGIMDINNNIHVDNFMRINECDIYKDFFVNEFEWNNIRKAGREYIQDNIENFYDRFQFKIPLKLGRYDYDTQIFEVDVESQIRESRRFQVLSSTIGDPVCFEYLVEIEGYPEALVLELSRPFHLVSFPVSKDLAERYVRQATEYFHSLPSYSRTQNNLLKYRDAVLVFNVRIISASEDEYIRSESTVYRPVLAIMEGYEIHSAFEGKDVLYKRSYLKKNLQEGQGEEPDAEESSGN